MEDFKAKTVAELREIMCTGFRRDRIAAANEEYWRRVAAGEHTPPPAGDVIPEPESPAAFTRRMLAQLSD